MLSKPNVAAALEHQVFEQVGVSALAGAFVAAAHVVGDVHVDDRDAAILVEDHVQPVRQLVPLRRDGDRGRGLRVRGGGGHQRRNQRWQG